MMFASKANLGALTFVRRPDSRCDEGCVFSGHPLFARMGRSLIAGSPVPLRLSPAAES
jgi:hypothetical protein